MMYNLILKDKNNEVIKRNHVTSDKHFHFIAREMFYVELVEYSKTDGSPYIPTLHSVLQVGDQIIHNVTDDVTHMLSGNFCYSLYFTENNQDVTIRIIQASTNKSMVYNIKFIDGNIIDETNSHYLDLLTNHFLPSYEELQKAIVNAPHYDKRELLKRLLLDFRSITKNKGTKQAVENFFKFLGYDENEGEQLNLYEEFRRDDGSLTLDPNMSKDVKTGRYYVLYDYYQYLHPKYDEDNLPNVEIVITDHDEFLNRVMYAIQMANIYFTLDEQEIVYFSTVLSSNVPSYQNIQHSMVVSSEYDIMRFRKGLNVDAFVMENQNTRINKVINKVQTSQMLNATEVKYLIYVDSDIDFKNHNSDFYRINEEIFDSETIGDEDFDDDGLSIVDDGGDLNYLYRSFGTILNFEISATVGLEVEYKFYLKSTYNEDDQYTYIKRQRMLLQEKLTDSIFCFKNTEYDDNYVLEVSVFDDTNNKDTYFYEFILSKGDIHIDVRSYNSSTILPINDLTIDVTSADRSISRQMFEFHDYLVYNYILPLNLIIGQDLSQYYQQTEISNVKWLNTNDVKDERLTEFYKGFTLNDNTRIPLQYDDTFVEILTFPDDGRSLKLRVYDPIEGYKFIDLNETPKHIDCLFVCRMLIEEHGWYYFIMTTITGVQLLRNLYDFYLIGDVNESIHELSNVTIRKIDVNYDIPLHINPDSENIEEVYVSDTGHYITIDNEQIKCIWSLYPRLIEKNLSPKDAYHLKLNDVIFCKLDENLIDTHHDTVWEVRDSFNPDILLHRSRTKNLKFRVNRKTCFDIICKTEKFNHEIILTKQSINTAMNTFNI